MKQDDKPGFRQERRRRIRELRQRGHTTKQIARTLARDYDESLLKASRWAYDWTLAEAVGRYNNDVAEGPEHHLTRQGLSLIENWPRSANPDSRPPGIPLLQGLAKVYHCAPGDLIEGTDYSFQAERPAATAATAATVEPPSHEPVPADDTAPWDAEAHVRKQAGEVLGRLRREAGLTQQDLANRIGYARAHLAGAEKGYNRTASEFWERCDAVLAAGGALVAAGAQIKAAQGARARAAVLREEAAREARLQQWRAQHDLPELVLPASPDPPAVTEPHGPVANEQLRIYRERLGLTQEELADELARVVWEQRGKRVGITGGMVSKWERGERRPSRWYREAYRVLCNATNAELGFGTAELAVTAADRAMLIASPEHGKSVERRKLLKGIGSLVAGVAVNPRLKDLVTSEPHALLHTLGATSVDATTMEYYDAVTEELGLRYPTVAPIVLLDGTVECFSAIRQLVEMRSTSVQYRRLCWLGARLAGMTGVILHETNDHINAKVWFAAADKAAHESEDQQLRAWLLVKKALIPTYTGQPQAVLRLMNEAASLIPHGRGAVAARVYANAARAHAAMGDPDDFEKSMDRARAALEQAPEEDRRGGVFCFTDKQLAFYTGTGYIRLKRPAAAREAINEAMALYRPTELMDPAIMRIDVAVSYFQQNEIEEACRWAIQAIEVPASYRNGSLLQRTVELQQLLRRHADVVLVREFDERFRNWTTSA